jgi:predicted outer membrane protein
VKPTTAAPVLRSFRVAGIGIAFLSHGHRETHFMSCRIHTSAAFVAVLSVATWASAQSSPATEDAGKQSADSGFATEAAEGGLAEVQLGQLATQKASNEDVKRFGQMMVDDHSKANEQLNQIAQSKHLSVPQKVNSKNQAAFERLSGLTGESVR